MTRHMSIGRLFNLIRRPGFWVILVTLVLITTVHYEKALQHPVFITSLFTDFGLTRHSFERVLYLAPIIWGSVLFGRKGGIIISFLTVALMLPNAIFFSSSPLDDVFVIAAVFIMGGIMATTIGAVHRERERRTQLEAAEQQLRTSEERYRGLFENALDAIWLQDFEGNLITANESAAKLSGYSVKELVKMNVRDFLSGDSLKLAHEIRRRLLALENVEQPYEQKMVRGDKSEAIVQLVTSLVLDKGKPVAFQHIARDITEQKRLQENLRFYSQQVIRILENERERISHGVYNEVIQLLTVHSRHLEALAWSNGGLLEKNRNLVSNLMQQTNNLVQELRRLGSELRPPELDHLGLLPALESLSSRVAERSGISTKVSVSGTARRLPKETELVLFRIAEEALRNSWRHSGAAEVDIVVEYGENNTRITISDNGKGSNLPKSISDLVRDGKLGLADMQERALLVGGTLTIQSKPNKGTSIIMEIPE